MKKNFLSILLIVFTGFVLNAQVKYETFESSKLGETREIKILLPRSYKTDRNKEYPVIFVLDGDYLFEAVSGNVDYYSYWEDMPESVVVGINQVGKRYDDCLYSKQNSLPIESGANFFEFLGMELLPYIEQNYRTTNFRVIVGHGETANFINYYLLKPQPLFQAYITISPELAPDMITYLPEQLKKVQTSTFYYLANTHNDTESIKKATSALDTDLAAIENDKLLYSFDSFEKPSHYSVPLSAIPNALQNFFSVYQPISKKEYQETILKLDGSPVEYLQKKYEDIFNLYGLKKKILINDFRAIAAAIEKNEKFDDYEQLGKIARDLYPKTLLGSYYLARFYEEKGESKKAMRTYQSGYTLDEIAGITKDEMLQKAEAIKSDFGY